jgi:hypothetical protein
MGYFHGIDRSNQRSFQGHNSHRLAVQCREFNIETFASNVNENHGADVPPNKSMLRQVLRQCHKLKFFHIGSLLRGHAVINRGL